jgi:glycosyltransferase involved in cell wall biosynthesis
VRILALEPYYGGSHKAFLDGWRARSEHTFDVHTLPPFKWKWRMRHAAVTFAETINRAIDAGESWDILFCSDMLNLAEFKGLVPRLDCPGIVYFHENQLTYPVQVEDERDYQYVFTNFSTALAADAIWFNSGFHRDEFIEQLPVFFKKMPDYQPIDAVETLRPKSSIHPPGIELPPTIAEREDGPLHILWAARWEHDKGPEHFFSILSLLDRNADWVLSVVGEQFRNTPRIFEQAYDLYHSRIRHWGYQDSRADYLRVLDEADVIVSTALHEFFGIGVAEAVGHGCIPLVPTRLAYPETLDVGTNPHFFYEGWAEDCARQLNALIADRSRLTQSHRQEARAVIERFAWSQLVPEMDAAVQALMTGASGS